MASLGPCERAEPCLRADVGRRDQHGALRYPCLLYTSAAAQKIVDGKLEKYYSTACLIDQSFVKAPEKTVKELLTETIAKTGENIQIRRFVRFQLGS